MKISIPGRRQTTTLHNFLFTEQPENQRASMQTITTASWEEIFY